MEERVDGLYFYMIGWATQRLKLLPFYIGSERHHCDSRCVPDRDYAAHTPSFGYQIAAHLCQRVTTRYHILAARMQERPRAISDGLA